jgi:hypothetical protein
VQEFANAEDPTAGVYGAEDDDDEPVENSYLCRHASLPLLTSPALWIWHITHNIALIGNVYQAAAPAEEEEEEEEEEEVLDEASEEVTCPLQELILNQNPKCR